MQKKKGLAKRNVTDDANLDALSSKAALVSCAQDSGLFMSCAQLWNCSLRVKDSDIVDNALWLVHRYLSVDKYNGPSVCISYYSCSNNNFFFES